MRALRARLLLLKRATGGTGCLQAGSMSKTTRKHVEREAEILYYAKST